MRFITTKSTLSQYVLEKVVDTILERKIIAPRLVRPCILHDLLFLLATIVCEETVGLGQTGGEAPCRVSVPVYILTSTRDQLKRHNCMHRKRLLLFLHLQNELT